MLKPIEVLSGNFTTANIQADNLALISIATMLNQTMWKNKWNGHLGLRATCVVRAEINSMPFQAGLLMLKFFPNEASDNASALRNGHIMQSSQLPGAIFSLKQTDATIKIPFRAPYYYFDLTGSSDSFNWGNVVLKVYTPLRTAATSQNSVSWSLWVSWEDVELFVPTMPQANWPVVSSRTRSGVKALKARSANEKEVGPVTQFFGAATKMANSLRGVPLIGPIMGHTEWFANLASGVASAFGWSKPPIVSDVIRVNKNLHAYGNNADGCDTSLSLGVLVEPSISPICDIGLTDEDEMSVAFIKRQWSYATTLQWSTASTGGLFATPISPNVFVQIQTAVGLGNTVTYMYETPVGFLGRLARYYRGGFEIRIRVAKTDYHSGRLMASWCPGYSNPLGVNMEYLLREIVDIRVGETFCFVLPYMVSRSWSRREDPIGYFRLDVINPLKAVSTVDTTVDIIVEFRAAQDFSISCPTDDVLQPFMPQMDTTKAASNELRCDVIASIDEANILDNESEITMGEEITSLAQLAKRFTRMTVRGVTPATAAAGTIYPFGTGGVRRASVGVPVTIGALACDNISLFTSLYGYWRGGVRIKTISDPGSYTQFAWVAFAGAGNTYSSQYISTDVGLSGGLLSSLNAYGMASPVVFPGDNGGFSLRIAPYQPGRYRRYVLSIVNTDVIAPNDTNLIIKWNTVGTPPTNGSMWRAASDDFQCGLFCCIPTLATSIT